MEIEGPAMVQLDAAIGTAPGPVKVQLGGPVGATDPTVPVIFPVKVMTCPLPVLD